MGETRDGRIYARGILPFFILFSVVALRADLVLVSVGIRKRQLKSGTGGGGNELWRENTTNLLQICPFFLVVWGIVE